MDPSHLNCDDNSTEASSFKELFLQSSPKISGISGDPWVYPRVGDEYQAEIPPIMTKTESLQLPLNACDSKGIFDGLPMPVTWIHNTITAKEDEVCRRKNLDHSPSENRSTKLRSKKNDKTKVELKDGDKYLVPDSLYHTWSDAEGNSFIFSFYLFGKNFVKIKKFLDKKEMEDILSFYYGKFYRSEAYTRWSIRQHTKRKKCIYGRKLFTGWRKEELLSRLHPFVPEKSRNSLLEVLTTFSERKLSLENFVCKLKAVVGIEALVEAIGIGKANFDLTILSKEPGKSSLLLVNRKTCSSLTCSDIIKLLSGEFRLSKARCNDVFWEAVWPRLLGRGWHSEQPRNQSFLVFLIPGVKKFSKRKLVKGEHYFDSVNDVLNKVAFQPKLIELEDEEAAKGGSSEEENCTKEIQQTHRYLKPRISNLKLVRFTVVDSSLIDARKLCKMREMRYIPHDLENKSLFTSLSSGIEMKYFNNSESNYCEKESGDFGSSSVNFTIVDSSLRNGDLLKVKELRFSPRIKVTSETKNSSRKRKCASKCLSNLRVSEAKSEALNDEKDIRRFNLCRDKSESDNEPLVNLKIRRNQSARQRTIKHQSCRGSKSGHSNNLVPVVKRRRLTACLGIETSTRSCIDLDTKNDVPDKPNPEALTESADVCKAEESNGDLRRLSKRNRPMTARALEALEYELITTKRERSRAVQRKRERTLKGGSDLEEKDVNGALEKKDLVDENPDRSTVEHE